MEHPDFSTGMAEWPFGIDQEKVAGYLDYLSASIRAGDIQVSRAIQQQVAEAEEFGSNRLLLWFEEKK